MKKECQTKSLGDVCDFEGGSQPPKSEFIYEEKPDYVRFLQIRDFGSDKNITYIRQSKKNRLCIESDILIGRYGASVGKILTGKVGAYNVALMKTIPNLEILDQSWFYYFLISDEFQTPLLNVADRSAQAGFSKEDIYNFSIPTPPLPEQQRIVAILDEAFAGITTAKANAEQNLKNARELFESHLQAVFTETGEGWMETTLGELAEFKNGLNFTKSSKGQTLPVVGVGDFQNHDDLPLENLGSVTIDGKLSDDYLIKRNDILTVRSNGSKHLVGRCILVPEINDDTSFSGFIIRIRCNESVIEPRFLLRYMKTQFIRERLTSDGGGANITNINQAKLTTLPVVLPPLKIQREIVKKLEELLSETHILEAIYQQKIAALDELKKALLHKAFSGEL